MSISYMWEVFYTGTKGLASGTGRIQDRLENTFGSYLSARLNGPNTLPPELDAKAKDIMKRMTCVAAGGEEGTIAATCRLMTDEEATKIADTVVSIFNDVCMIYGAEQERQKEKGTPKG